MAILGRGLDQFNYYTTEEIRNVLELNYFQPSRFSDGEKRLEDVNSIDDIWTYITDIAIPVLMNEKYPNGTTIEDTNLQDFVVGQNKVGLAPLNFFFPLLEILNLLRIVIGRC